MKNTILLPAQGKNQGSERLCLSSEWQGIPDTDEIIQKTWGRLVFANRDRTRTSPLKSSNFHGTRITYITESTWQKCVLLPYWIIVRVSLRLGRLSLLPVAGSTNRTNRKLLMATKYFFKISSRHQVSVVMVQIHWTLFGICLIWLIFFIRYESATSMSVTDVGDEMCGWQFRDVDDGFASFRH